ncbi:low affinity iron permease family protein [Lysobacter soli]|uniref:low affinity iron permease family protein n=1 Tax=Lysobacter soli TaxID=453783 RepID=UPI0020A11A03|nr:low affinity iron permease family protein [Lysobacter soli]UTA55954.1 low affinity iron permease family protein [Lysobacter soli]
MDWHSKFAKSAARWTGNASCFGLAVLVVVVWLVSGPMFGFSDTWQLVINTGTTIITFLMVFLIQNTQNRDTEAMQIKLDELIRATRMAENTLLDLEELDQAELDRLRKRYEELARLAREHSDSRRRDSPAHEHARKRDAARSGEHDGGDEDRGEHREPAPRGE